MSDQQQASGESSAHETATTSPDAEAVAAQLTGTGEAQTAPVPQGTDAGSSAPSGPEAGGDTEEESRPTPSPSTEGLKAGETASAEATAEEAESGEAQGGENEKGAAENPPGEAGPDGNSARALSAAATGEHHRAVAAAATAKGAAGSTRSAVGRPGKPVLAGAALAGALLVAVPLLIALTGDDEEKKTVDNAAADTVLSDAGGPAGVFATRSPSPAKTKPEKKKQKAEPGSPAGEKAGAPAPAPSPSPSKKAKKAEKAETKKKAASKKAPSNLPAVMTRVLIKNNTNHTCVDVPGFASGRPDGPVTHATCNSNTDDNQLWNVEKRYASAGPGGAPLFQIRNVMDGMCLDLPGYQGVGGATKVTEFPCNGTTKDNQLWWLDKQSDGRFWIRNAASNNQCLDSYANNDNTRNLIIWPCAPEGQNNHEWAFTRS
ncbi:RICIN domain-containing protein [Streptomyces sp. NPDC048484]|uniref:RICIN domain-containing protein n=1 Tax=Streptomyces sp. NPDC048484 TaxID=3155146 RepID=UPI003442C2D1